ncbi:hypothetical protein ACCO45_007231 [Purpureocillium lilacinum]|uniref:Uncharacterized protein n=1 Tax=Purpureocillium lilacinum TaxID=33203 RepID=A0ACC4DU49_PURLI
MAAVARQLGFMSILVFDNKGKRVQVSDGATYRGPYVDSPQTLARLETAPGTQYTLVVDQHEFPLSSYTFTLSIFSHTELAVREAEESMSHFTEKTGSWGRRTAGGNPSCPTYYQNPQYKLSINRASPLSILLSTDSTNVHVHIDLIWARGERVSTIRVKDLVASSGEYRRGCAVAEVPELEAGDYTMVCSTFDAGQTADFAVRVASMVPVALSPIAADGAGRLRTALGAFRLSEGDEKSRIPPARVVADAGQRLHPQRAAARRRGRRAAGLVPHGPGIGRAGLRAGTGDGGRLGQRRVSGPCHGYPHSRLRHRPSHGAECGPVARCGVHRHPPDGVGRGRRDPQRLSRAGRGLGAVLTSAGAVGTPYTPLPESIPDQMILAGECDYVRVGSARLLCAETDLHIIYVTWCV